MRLAFGWSGRVVSSEPSSPPGFVSDLLMSRRLRAMFRCVRRCLLRSRPGVLETASRPSRPVPSCGPDCFRFSIPGVVLETSVLPARDGRLRGATARRFAAAARLSNASRLFSACRSRDPRRLAASFRASEPVGGDAMTLRIVPEIQSKTNPIANGRMGFSKLFDPAQHAPGMPPAADRLTDEGRQGHSAYCGERTSCAAACRLFVRQDGMGCELIGEKLERVFTRKQPIGSRRICRQASTSCVHRFTFEAPNRSEFTH